MQEYFRQIGLKRIIYTILGVVILGIGITGLRLSGFGTDPYSCMNIGLSSHLPISYGTLQMIENVLLFIPIIIFYPRSFGLGALFNMLCLGYIVDFCMWLCSLVGVTVEAVAGYIAMRILLLLVGLLVFCFGVALYMHCDLGIAPYDMIGQIIDDRTHGRYPFKWARVTTDLLCMVIGFVSGGTVGIATVVVAFFTGPVVSWFREHIASRLLEVPKVPQ
ncbi:MAG: hypothetical protein K2K56_01705 [Lachnospiraceae bacterium]|nr:hypothetical protein [Lachnospiraceae bacterium]